MNIIVFSTKSYDREFLQKANETHGHTFLFLEAALTPETAGLTHGYQAVCAFVNDDLNDEVLDALAPEVKLIALRASGFNNVDIRYARQKGISVVRVPAYSPHAIAEHAVALIMTLNRKTHKAYNRVRENNFSLERLTGFDLYGKTVGVVGTGKIGAVFCDIMRGFGCTILAYDKYPSEEQIKRGTQYTSLNDLLGQSDIVSLHCPLTPETHHLINPESLAVMKQGAMLINTSRGKLIDTKAVIKALKHGSLAYLGIDVYEQEESLFFSDLSEYVIQDDKIARLMTFPNVLITAHQAFFTSNALTQIASTTLQNITDFADGKPLVNQVTIDMVK